MIFKHFTFFLTILAVLSFQSSFEASAAVFKTKNFVVHAADPDLAREFALTAEYQRKKQAIDWLGAPLRDWAKPCQVKVKVGDNLAPGGATTFVFSNGEVYDWDMNIQGSAERIIDSVIPHEVTHTIFACRFRQPVPRWVDEGAATSVEHISEKTKYRRMLVEFLQTNRGIAFRTMVNAKEYPPDAMPFYAQSYTAAEYLIARGGRKRYIAFVEMGIQTNDWSKALQQYYGYDNLAQFQNVWLTWVSNQFPAIDNDLMRDDIRLASVNAPIEPNEQYARVARPEPNLLLRTPVSTAHPNAVIEASYNAVATTSAPQPSAIQDISTVSEPMPEPNGVWDEIAPASYNEIAPAAAEAAPAPRTKLNWLPGDVIPLNVSPQNVQR
ncbi:MAG: hypothetical protein IKX40_14350 [Thermoguttaceae bacterium]|nr:hypothetical protein [Thermoguttaceae bacterium]